MEVEIKCSSIDVTPIMEPDPNWQHKCECGVVHKWHSDDKEFKTRPAMCETSLPTMRYIIDFEGTDDLPSRGHYECKKCGQEVIPAERSPAFKYYVQGRKEIYVDGRQVTEEEYKNLVV